MTLSTLRTRLETATEADQARLLKMAFALLVETLPDAIGNPSWLEAIDGCFQHMMEAKAYESAALLIMREVLPGWSGASLFCPKAVFPYREYLHPIETLPADLAGMKFTGLGTCKALAIIAAICAAKSDDA